MNLLKRVLITIIVFLPISAIAELGQVSINGEPLDSEVLIAYKTHAIPDEQFCYPNTDQFVIASVVGRSLIIEAGREAGYADAQLLEAPPELTDEETPEDLFFRYAFIGAMIYTESEKYIEPLIGDAATFDAKQVYLQMLSADDPLVVNVTLVRAAHMQFSTFSTANEVLKRLNNKEPIDEVAGNLGYANEYYNQQKAAWWHAAALPEMNGGDAPAPGSLFGPFYAAGQWRIGQVLEARKLPVMLLDDRTEPFASLTYDLREKFEKDNFHALVEKLWNSADVKLDGKALEYPGYDYCNQPVL